MEDSPRWVKAVQEQEREIERLKGENARLRAALTHALAILSVEAPMRAREILELRRELHDEK